MNCERLDYAGPERPAPRRLPPWGVASLAFPACWLFVLVIYWGGTFPDGFEDEVFNWGDGLFVAGVLGTPVGFVAYAITGAVLVRRRGVAAVRWDGPGAQGEEKGAGVSAAGFES